MLTIPARFAGSLFQVAVDAMMERVNMIESDDNVVGYSYINGRERKQALLIDTSR